MARQLPQITQPQTRTPAVMRLFNAQKPRVSVAFPDLIRLHWIVSLDQEGEQRFWKSEHVIHHSKLNHPNPQTNPQTPATTCNNDLKSPVKLHSLREVSWFNKNNNALLGAQRALAYFVVRCPWRLVLKAWVLLCDRLGWYLVPSKNSYVPAQSCRLQVVLGGTTTRIKTRWASALESVLNS